MLLGGQARVGARRVHEREQRETEAPGELHHAHRLAVPLGRGGAEVAADALLQVAPLLVPADRHGAAVEPRQSGDDRAVVGASPVAVQLDPVLADPADVVERVRALLVAGQLDGAPDLVVARLGLHPLELALELRELALEAGPAEELQVPQLGEPLAQPQLGLTWSH